MADSSDMIRNIYAAFSSGDVPAVLGALAADVHCTEAEGFPDGGTYIGGVAKRLYDTWHRVGSSS